MRERSSRAVSITGAGSLEGVLFYGIDVRLERVSVSAEVLCVEAAACGPPPRCPGCRARARRVHSAYERSLGERPLGGRQLVVRLRVRRFFCGQAVLPTPLRSSSRSTG
ncbi:transposase family protein [Streptomyces sp. NPDC053069]|uniref:transposase family protein n=1 Tax=Streptomyces sp. NPDC053069 TaxID=3365695 RepID=UPI0037CE4711